LKPIPREPACERGGLRDALVDEGRKMFEEIGAGELSLRALARRLGVSEAAPSRHFSGKEELLAAIAVSGFQELAQQRTKIAAQKLEPLPKARAMMLSCVRYAQSHAGLQTIALLKLKLNSIPRIALVLNRSARDTRPGPGLGP